MTDQPPPRSGCVGGVAVIDGLAAAVLARALVDWRRSVPAGIAPQDFREVEAAVAALRQAAASWVADLERERLGSSAAGSAEEHGKSAAADSGVWIDTNTAASLLGVSARRVRQLASERKLECERVDGRMHFRRTQVLRRRTMTVSS